MVIFGIGCLSAQAGEVGVLFDKEIGKSQVVAAGVAGIPAAKYDAVSPTGVGFRLGYSVLDLKVAEFGLALTYHPKVEGDLVASGYAPLGKYGNEYIAFGVQADWKFLVNLHAGIDMRSEKMTMTQGATKDSTTVTRPWVKAGVGFSVPTPVVSPFVRLEVAVPLTKEDKTTTPEEFRKAMAPAVQVSLYGGIRF